MTAHQKPTLGNGKICYLQLPATDIDVSSSFYGSVFGWNIRKRGDGVTAFDDGVGEVSGIWVTGKKPHDGNGLVLYIMVADIHATIAKIREQGGGIVREADTGKDITAFFRDPAGNIFGIYQEPSLQR